MSECWEMIENEDTFYISSKHSVCKELKSLHVMSSHLGLVWTGESGVTSQLFSMIYDSHHNICQFG